MHVLLVPVHQPVEQCTEAVEPAGRALQLALAPHEPQLRELRTAPDGALAEYVPHRLPHRKHEHARVPQVHE